MRRGAGGWAPAAGRHGGDSGSADERLEDWYVRAKRTRLRGVLGAARRHLVAPPILAVAPLEQQTLACEGMVKGEIPYGTMCQL
jgi:hypothetical protein